MQTKTFVVAIVLATALSVASCGSTNGLPTAPGSGGDGGPLGGSPGAPLPGVGTVVRLVDSEGRETSLVATMGNLAPVSCGPSAPPGRHCIALGEGSSIRFERLPTYLIDSPADVTMFVSRDCEATSTEMGGAMSVLPGEVRPMVSSLNGGTRVLDYRPCGTVFEAVYRVRDTPNDSPRKVSARGAVKFE